MCQARLAAGAQCMIPMELCSSLPQHPPVRDPAGLRTRLVCGHSDEAAKAAVHPAGLQEHMRAIGVVHGEGQAVAEGVVHVGLRTSTCVRSGVGTALCFALLAKDATVLEHVSQVDHFPWQTQNIGLLKLLDGTCSC